jgi:glycosyltransferase involved in cell wall biosynthesis
MKILVIIPSFNSADALENIFKALQAYPELDILVVDDGSSDHTVGVAERYHAALIRHSRNLGKGAALKNGFEYAEKHAYDTVITMDADGQHPVSSIPRFLETHAQHPEAVLIGMRRRKSPMPLNRRMSNHISAALISIRTGRSFYDAQCGFRLIPVSCLKRPLPRRNGFIFESEMLILLALNRIPLIEIPIPTLYPTDGVTKMRYLDSTFDFIFMYIASFFKSYQWSEHDPQ